MDSLLRFNSQTTGRDKLFRLCQYSARLLWAILEKRGKEQTLVRKLKELEATLSTSRKLFCWGRCLDVIYSGLQTVSLPDSMLRVTLTLSRIASSLYLLSDHVIWLARVGLIDINRRKWTRFSTKCWLYSIIMNLVRDYYEIMRVLKAKENSYSSSTYHGLHRMGSPQRSRLPQELDILQKWLLANRSVSADTLKNACDLWLPLSQLGHVKLSPATVGFLGVVSSSAAILQIVDYSCRLSPS